MRWVLTFSGVTAVTALVGYAHIVSAYPSQRSAWYCIVLLACSAVLGAVFLVTLVICIMKYRTELLRKYRKPAAPINLTLEAHPVAMRRGNEVTFTTSNSRNWKFEYDEPIQSVWFVEPEERVISARDDVLPVFINCERRILCRLRNRILGIPAPRIAVTEFTERGIVLDEEHTYGIDVKLRLMAKPPQVKPLS